MQKKIKSESGDKKASSKKIRKKMNKRMRKFFIWKYDLKVEKDNRNDVMARTELSSVNDSLPIYPFIL